MRFWFARASSHSSVYVEVAQFNNKKDAKNALKALRALIKEVNTGKQEWDWEEARCDLSPDRLCFSAYTSGYGLDEVESLIEKQGGKIVASGQYLHSISFIVTKPSWNEVKAILMVVNLLHNKVLDPESYMDAKVRKSTKDGKCVWTLDAITDDYDEDEGLVKGESLEELRQLGVNVLIEPL